MRGDSHRAKPICRFQAEPGSVRGGFAMAEASVLLTAALRQFKFAPFATPVPVAHLTVLSRWNYTRGLSALARSIVIENKQSNG